MKKKLREDDFFFCYDKELAQRLKKMGNRYIHSARSISTGDIFTLFHKDEKFHYSLKQIKKEENK